MAAQLDAGDVGDGALRWGAEADLELLADRAPLDVVDALSSKLGAFEGRIDETSVHDSRTRPLQ